MNPYTWAVAKAAATAFELAEPVVEMGSKQYGEQIGQYPLKTLFPGKHHIGCDLEEGPGVDRIENITGLTFKDGEVGTMICFHILEHVWDVFTSVREMTRVVKEGGCAMIVCPFYLHIHRYPKDFWRFTDDTMRQLMSGFPWVIVGRHGYATMPRDVFAIGFQRERFPDFDERLARFREVLDLEGKDRVGWVQRLRMGLAYSLFSKKYFRDFIHRDETHIDVVRPQGK